MYYPCSENKGADQLRGYAKLICVFVFVYAKKRFFTTRLICNFSVRVLIESYPGHCLLFEYVYGKYNDAQIFKRTRIYAIQHHKWDFDTNPVEYTVVMNAFHHYQTSLHVLFDLLWNFLFHCLFLAHSSPGFSGCSFVLALRCHHVP